MFASLVLSMAAATKKKKRKEEAYPWKAGASSGHIANLKQSILETFDIYGSKRYEVHISDVISMVDIRTYVLQRVVPCTMKHYRFIICGKWTYFVVS